MKPLERAAAYPVLGLPVNPEHDVPRVFALTKGKKPIVYPVKQFRDGPLIGRPNAPKIA